MKKFTIDRAKWLNGELYKRYEKADLAAPTGCLYEDGMKCCLGFYVESCGVSLRTMKGYAFPSELEGGRNVDKIAEAIIDNESNLAEINDSTDLSPKKREVAITKAFAEQGIKVSFKGKYPTVKIFVG